MSIIFYRFLQHFRPIVNIRQKLLYLAILFKDFIRKIVIKIRKDQGIILVFLLCLWLLFETKES